MTIDRGETTTSGKGARTRAAGAAPGVGLVHPAMQFTVSNASASSHRANVMVVGAFAGQELASGAKVLETASKGRLSALLKRSDLRPKPGSTVMFHDLPGIGAERVLVVSLGDRAHLDENAWFEALTGAAKTLASCRAQDIAVALGEPEVPQRPLEWHLQHATRIVADGTYRFPAPKKANGDGDATVGARNVVLLISGNVTPELEASVRRGQAIADGMALTRDLGNLPGNICTPAYLAQTALALARELNLETDVLERADMEALGMGSALSVGRASENPCKFIVMKYRGGGDSKPIVLIGKGVTFDTGGISLKPGENLDMMKYDMCGAASVFGAVKMAARLQLPINLIGIVSAVENMPGGNASRPGDVVTSMSGQTIEILNTDAEGRLVLCDALTYAERFEPACVIDIATLTGACVIALGTQTSGLFANDEALGAELLACAKDSGDRAWQLPLWDVYQEQLKSNFADMSNLGGRPAGTITAACFLSRFAKAYRWAHLDIAGTASIGGDEKGATGRPVPLLAEFLVRQSAAVAPGSA
jgi:leucyl aminopeptidase